MRPDAELAAVSEETVLDEVRVNADGTLDFTRWSRPQADGPAVQCLALLRWQRQCPHLDTSIQIIMRKLVNADLGYTLAHAQWPSFDIWEEEIGFHYYTRLVQTEALTQGAEWLDGIGQNARARDCRVAASKILPQLDALWDDAAGFYRSRGNEAANKTGKELDIAVILAVLHAGRSAGAHSVSIRKRKPPCRRWKSFSKPITPSIVTCLMAEAPHWGAMRTTPITAGVPISSRRWRRRNSISNWRRRSRAGPR